MVVSCREVSKYRDISRYLPLPVNLYIAIYRAIYAKWLAINDNDICLKNSDKYTNAKGCVCAQEASSTWPCPSQSASSVWVVLKVRPAPLVLLGCPLCVSPALLTGVPVRRRAVRESPSNANVSDHSLRCWYFRVVNSLIAPAFYFELSFRMTCA